MGLSPPRQHALCKYYEVYGQRVILSGPWRKGMSKLAKLRYA